MREKKKRAAARIKRDVKGAQGPFHIKDVLDRVLRDYTAKERVV